MLYMGWLIVPYILVIEINWYTYINSIDNAMVIIKPSVELINSQVSSYFHDNRRKMLESLICISYNICRLNRNEACEWKNIKVELQISY